MGVLAMSMHAAEIIEVVKGYLDGKQIQVRPAHILTSPWDDVSGEPAWDFWSNDYRVKPEPRQWWIFQEREGGSIVGLNYKPANPNWIHVREVLD